MAASKEIWQGWVDRGQRKLFDAEIETLLDTIEALNKQGNKAVRDIFRFLDKNGKRDWSRVDLAVDDMLQEIRDNLGTIGRPMSGIVNGTVGASLEQINAVGHMIGRPLGTFDVYGSYVKAQERHVLRLSDKATREGIDQIYQALHNGWGKPGSDILTDVKRSLGVDRDALTAYRTAVEKFKDAPPLVQFKEINAALGNQETLAWKAQRIVRSESGIINDDINRSWIDTLDDVAFEEFVNEAGACDLCVSLAGFYPKGEAPRPVIDTHPNCNCGLRPAFGGERIAEKDIKDAYNEPPRYKAKVVRQVG